MTTAHARHTDPPTSHAAAAHVETSGVAASQREAVLDLVRRFPGCTSAELVGGGLDRYQLARRLPELEHRGLVRKGPQALCRVMGRQAITWWPVEAQEKLL